MSAEACRATFEGAETLKRAESLDAAFPQCTCEPWSLTSSGGPGLQDDELVARILTSPDAYEEDTSTILTSKLTQIYAMGMSVVRQGASDAEIASTVQDLLSNASEVRKLIGAVVIGVSALRAYANDDDAARWFGVYATDDRGKTHHVDVLGTKVGKGAQSRRRNRLAADMTPLLVRADNVIDLIANLRASGI